MGPRTLCEMVTVAAERDPGALAMRCLEEQLTYGELEHRANQVAHVLVQHGVERGDRVGLLLGKGIDALVALHGIMKAAACYVPLDTNAPARRIATCLGDGDVRVAVTTPEHGGFVGELLDEGWSPELLVGLESDERLAVLPWSSVRTAPESPPARRVLADDLAYIIFTSGSTGAPKGIPHTHASSLAFVAWAADAYGLTAADKLSQLAELHFDMSVFDLFVAQYVGAATVVVPTAYARFPASLSALLQSERVSVVFTVPFLLSHLESRGALDERDLTALRWVIFGGDGHSVPDILALMARWPHARFSHMYGPAETNGCTYALLEAGAAPPAGEPFDIGQPCPAMRCLVIDVCGDEVAAGAEGELAISGPSVMAGYWRRPDLDEAAFFERVDDDGQHRRYYRSGDRVRTLQSGALQFLGRMDRQLKVRGHRVELDEVEAALMDHPAVIEAGVVGIRDDTGSVALAAAVQLQREVPHAELLQHVAARLPSYAVPADVKVLDGFPRTGTGKLDRRALTRQLNG